MKNHYELLGIEPTATPEHVKRAFRQEIARYHPDKVQHLGREFQAMAADVAAQLTQAYRTLMDPELRVEYDRLLQTGADGGTVRASAPAAERPPEAPPPPRESDAPVHPEAPPAQAYQSLFSQEKANRDQLVRRATLGRLRDALVAEFGDFEERLVKGFDLSCVARAKRFAWARGETRVLARFVTRVDASSIRETWPLAAKAAPETADVCVFLMGCDMAPARELAAAIADQRRQHARAKAKVVLIPVDVRDWHAHVPTDAQPVARTLLGRLRAPGLK